MAEHPQGRGGRERARRPQHQVEGDHVAVGEAQGLLEGHRSPSNQMGARAIPASVGGRESVAGAKLTAVTKTATRVSPKRKSLSEYIQERFDEFSRSQKDVARYIVDHLDEAAFLTAEELARRASTSSSTVVRFSQALGFEGYPELQQAAIEEYRDRAAAAAEQQPAAAPLFSFDHSELEASLGADYANLEETARNLTREQVDGVGRRAGRSAARRDRRRRPDGLLRQLPAPHARACSTSAPRSSPAPAASRCSGWAGSTRTRSSSCSPPAAPTRCCCGR